MIAFGCTLVISSVFDPSRGPFASMTHDSIVGSPEIQKSFVWLMTDNDYMARALELAERGRGWVEPNPLVGAVIVRDGRVVGEGWHEKFGQAHAEVNALRQAGEAARGSTLYVTLEPCSHFGKTPPCTEAVIGAGVRRVVASMLDPFPQVAGQGASRLREAGIDVEVGVGEVDGSPVERAVPEALAHRPPVGSCEMGHDPRWKDRDPHRRSQNGSPGKRPGPASTSCAAAWMPS